MEISKSYSIRTENDFPDSTIKDFSMVLIRNLLAMFIFLSLSQLPAMLWEQSNTNNILVKGSFGLVCWA